MKIKARLILSLCIVILGCGPTPSDYIVFRKHEIKEVFDKDLFRDCMKLYKPVQVYNASDEEEHYEGAYIEKCRSAAVIEIDMGEKLHYLLENGWKAFPCRQAAIGSAAQKACVAAGWKMRKEQNKPEIMNGAIGGSNEN